MLPMIGRPKSMETRKIVSLPAELARAIEDYRFKNRLKTEAQAIRQLIEAGLGAIGTRGGPRGGGTPGTRKPTSPGKTASPAKKPGKRAPAPKAKALGMSKEAQIRALREEGA
jgi:hypothetical protein